MIFMNMCAAKFVCEIVCRPELARAMVRRGDGKAEQGEQGELKVIKSGEHTQTNYSRSVGASISDGK